MPLLCYLSEIEVAWKFRVMPTIHMTKSVVDALKAGTKDTVYWDAGVPGFGVKVTPRGRKVFVALYRTGGAGSRPSGGGGPSSSSIRRSSKRTVCR